MTGQTISITAADGGRFNGYLAVPAAGSGPGLVLAQEVFGVNAHMRAVADLYAEEGYTVVVPDLFWRLEPGVELGHSEADMARAFGLYQRLDVARAVDDIGATVAAMRSLPAVRGKIGVLGFCLGGKLAFLSATAGQVDCAVAYYGVGIEDALDRPLAVPMTFHFAAEDKLVPPAAVERVQAKFAGRPDVEVFVYPGVDHAFNNPARPAYSKPAATLAHSRTIARLRGVLGPHYDLVALWEKHCLYEFGTRNVDDTMATMVPEPYVNHIPTMTGGFGYKDLYRFYKHHFIPRCPADTALTPISRTVGIDRVVDEMVFSFTHDMEIDWMLPGIKPTGRRVEVPLVAIVCFRGDKLFNEHIYWDQASVLVQIGLLDAKGLPVAGAETTRKLLDPSRPSNELMPNWPESAPRAAE